MKKLILTAVLLSAAILSGCSAQQTAASSAPVKETQPADAQKNTISVSSEKTIHVVPDMVEISFGVNTKADTAEEAMKKNTEDVNNVIAKLKELGVKDESIRTSDFNMYQDGNYYLNDTQNKDQAPRQYNVDTTLSVSDQTMDAAGKILTECTKEGINNITGIDYTYSKYDETYQEALKQAVSDAAGKAKVMAEAAGKTLGDPQSITEGYQNKSAQYDNTVMSKVAFDSVSSADTTSVMPGKIDITAYVSASYEIAK